jgi:hypothetical protein
VTIQKVATAAALCAALSGPAWAINKCTLADGKVVYQDAPCQGGGTTVNTSGAGQADANSEGSNYYKKEAARIATEENAQMAAQARASKISLAILNRKIVVGMTADEARRSWGEPIKVNASVGSYGRHEQWVYPGSQYVYVENGLVTAAQSPQ